MTKDTLLSCQNLTLSLKKKYKSFTLKDLNFEIDEGEIFGILGESGSGKSTLAKALAKILPINQGEILFQGKDIQKIQEKYPQSVQLILQNAQASLDPRKTAWQILLQTLDLRKENWSQKEKAQILMKIMQEVHLSSALYHKYSFELSGGECQRLSIARALCLLPQILICDEITASLDPSIQAGILELLKELQVKQKKSILFISHQLSLISQLCSTVLVLFQGQCMELAPSKVFFQSPMHPYSRFLLKTFPSLEEEREKKRLENYPLLQEKSKQVSHDACPYAYNCPYAEKKCQKERPRWRKIGEKHWLACHFNL